VGAPLILMKLGSIKIEYFGLCNFPEIMFTKIIIARRITKILIAYFECVRGFLDDRELVIGCEGPRSLLPIIFIYNCYIHYYG
jgi:hypothetical protein